MVQITQRLTEYLETCCANYPDHSKNL